MKVNVNCKHNEKGAWCKNKSVKRSLFGIGARCCVKFGSCSAHCDHVEEYIKPSSPPPPSSRP